MKKKSLTIIFISLLLISLVSAGERIYKTPEGMTTEEYQQSILKANLGFLRFLAIGSTYFRTCTLQRTEGTTPTCYPCRSNEVAGDCGYKCCDPAYVFECHNPVSKSSCTNPYSCFWGINSCTGNLVQKWCYCSVPTQQCSGGVDPGERKCEGDNIFECSDSGSWDFVKSCPYGCENGICNNQECQPHTEKRCYGGDVWWYDSCSNQEDMYEDCSNDETCENGVCIRECSEGWIGELTCDGLTVVRQYQKPDCSTEWKEVTICDFKCENGACVNPECPIKPDWAEPGQWTNCVNGQKSRTNYKCDDSTNYQWASFIETVNCDCSTDNDCREDEICESNICKKLECSEDQVVSNHSCINKQSNWLLILGMILIPLLLVSGLGYLTYIYVIKGKRRKRR